MDPSKLERLFEQQLKLMEMLAEAKLSSQAPASSPALPQSVDGITNSISEFTYDPDANITFDTWFRRYEDLFRVDFADKDDAWKVRLLLRKLGPSELDKYCNLILPQNPRDRTFDATIQSLSQLFGDHRSLFNTRYRCLKLVMNESDDFLTHIGIVNRECERFKLKSLTDDQFKSLVFICSLQSSKFADIRTRLLNRLEQDPSLTLNAIAEEYQRLINLQRDTTLIQSGGQGGSEVHAVQRQHKSVNPIPGQSIPITQSGLTTGSHIVQILLQRSPRHPAGTVEPGITSSSVPSNNTNAGAATKWVTKTISANRRYSSTNLIQNPDAALQKQNRLLLPTVSLPPSKATPQLAVNSRRFTLMVS